MVVNRLRVAGGLSFGAYWCVSNLLPCCLIVMDGGVDAEATGWIPVLVGAGNGGGRRWGRGGDGEGLGC